MIKRIGTNDKIEEGDILEICNHSEPLYLYSNGRLFEINPREYNILNKTDKKERELDLVFLMGMSNNSCLWISINTNRLNNT